MRKSSWLFYVEAPWPKTTIFDNRHDSKHEQQFLREAQILLSFQTFPIVFLPESPYYDRFHLLSLSTLLVLNAVLISLAPTRLLTHTQLKTRPPSDDI